MELLNIKDLNINFQSKNGLITAVHHLNLTLYQGETLGMTGESGSGKSQTALAILGLLAKNAQVSGSIAFESKDLLTLSKKELTQIRGNKIAIIFQDPMTSLNPFMKIGDQLAEVLIFHKGMSKKDAWGESIKMLDAVKIPEARKRINMYPHEFSGGMRQRIIIAMALLCHPKLLIADEPTTALDITIQAQIIALLNELKQDFATTILMITHDLNIIASSCDKMAVIQAGRMVSYGTTMEILHHSSHPYVMSLLNTIPSLNNNKYL